MYLAVEMPKQGIRWLSNVVMSSFGSFDFGGLFLVSYTHNRLMLSPWASTLWHIGCSLAAFLFSEDLGFFAFVTVLAFLEFSKALVSIDLTKCYDFLNSVFLISTF